MREPAPPPYRLVPGPPRTPKVLDLDAAQQAVLDHPGGPLLVLAGPGTGKTSTVVELVARRIEGGLRPDQILTLTFSRKAAHELRSRISARLAMPLGLPVAWTFHSWAFSWVSEQHGLNDLADGGLAGPGGASRLRLLSGAEQDVAIRDLLRGSVDTGRVEWPSVLRACLDTAGLASEVRSVLGRLAELGMGAADLDELGRRADRPDWRALAAFSDDYLDVLDARGVLDYAELVRRAVLLAETAEGQATLRQRYALVVVDEYQDTDPLQERLLHALAGDGRDLIAVGDPDQAIYAFRGGDVGQLLRFPSRFPQTGGAPAPTRALGTSRRCGPAILQAAARVSARIPAPGLDGPALAMHRSLTTVGPADATVRLTVCASATAEAETIAAQLRLRHVEHDTPWHEMAVLVRSAVRSLPLLRRVLTAAGVPVATSPDELPLAQEPAVAALLLALRCVGDLSALTADAVGELLSGPLIGADPGVLRRLARFLRATERGPGRVEPPPSAEALRAAVLSPTGLDGVPDQVGWPVRRLGDLLRAGAAAEGPETALWEIWAGSVAAHRWPHESDLGGPVGRVADRNLDAVVALFGYVARASESRHGVAGIGSLVDEIQAQEIPADSARERALGDVGVRLMTAHRSKGLEWDVVVVAGLQEGGWPDLRRRGTLLEPGSIDWPGPDGRPPPPPTQAERLADERRLLYVAMTRARRHLLLTAVSSAEESGPRPSRFLGEIGLPVIPATEDSARSATLDDVVLKLRRLVLDDRPLVRSAAAARLAALAAVTDHRGHALAPQADPQTWWGTRGQSRSARPVRDPGRAVALSGSSLASLKRCPLRWFLEHEVHAETAPAVAMSVGSIVHAIAREVVDGLTPATIGDVSRRLDEVWGHVGYEAAWQSAQQREVTIEALGRFLAWHRSDRGRDVLGAEVEYAVELDVPRPGDAGTVGVALKGSFDRVERDSTGAVWIVDYKTERRARTGPEVVRHPQLGTYQVAVRAGAVDGLVGGRPEVGGAELVQLKIDGDGPGSAKVQSQQPLRGARWVDEALGTAADQLLSERFPPLVSKDCERCAYRIACPAQAEGDQVLR